MRRKWKIGLVLAGAAVAFGAFWLWPSQEPAYEGKRLSEWLDEGLILEMNPQIYNGSSRHRHILEAVRTIGTNAIPFLLRDMERKEPRWLGSVKDRANSLTVINGTQLRRWRLHRSVWGFHVLGTNAAPALEMLLVLYDGNGDAIGSAEAALRALGPVAVPELVKRLSATNWVTRLRAAETLCCMGDAGESAIPELVGLVGDTNGAVRQNAVMALKFINRQPDRLVPLFRRLLGDSNVMIRADAAWGLGRFGLSAKEAIPDLIRATNDPNPTVVNSARQALKQIESEASKAASR